MRSEGASKESMIGTIISVVSIGFSAMLLDLFLVISALLFNRYAMIYGDYAVAGYTKL